MIKTHKNKIILLSVISLLTSEFLPSVFNNSKELEKGNLVSRVQLCCCGTGANTCLDCCCAKDFGENDDRHVTGVSKGLNDTGKHLVVITSCGGNSDDVSFFPDLTCLISKFSFVQYSPFTSSLETITSKLNNFFLEPSYKPPRLSPFPFSLI
jgi:hypothetical protein